MKVVLDIRKSNRKEAERIDQAVFGPMNGKIADIHAELQEPRSSFVRIIRNFGRMQQFSA